MPATDPLYPEKSGYTLVEMSVIIVIIGLIIGGILVGKDLMVASEVRAGISQIGEYDAAVNAFIVKYNAIPGDMTNASAYLTQTLWPGQVNTFMNGDGDGALSPAVLFEFYACYYDYESCGTFMALDAAKLVKVDVHPSEGSSIPGYCGLVPFPVSPLGGRILAYTNNTDQVSPYNSLFMTHRDDRNYWIVGFGIQYSDCNSLRPRSSVSLTPSRAYAVDNKLDDGMPLTGNVKLTGDDTGWGNIFYDQVPGAECVSAGSVYTTNDAQRCSLRILANW